MFLSNYIMRRISIHALHEESDSILENITAINPISIHALHEESDRLDSARVRSQRISIHALHEESDPKCDNHYVSISTYFNPRSP